MKHVVVVGGSHAGLATAHQILQQASRLSLHDIKITLVSRETHFFWNIAITRALIPGQYTDEQLFQPIEPGFQQYPKDAFEFVLGTLMTVDPQSNDVKVERKDGGEKFIQFDYLVLATGCQTTGAYPWKSLGSYEATLKALHSLQAKVEKATTIAVVGAGPTGVSIAGELAYEYRSSKKVILLSRKSTVLHDRPDFVSKSALAELERLAVVVKFGTIIASDLVDNGEVLLTSGEKLEANLFLPTYGQQPNTDFLHSQSLDEHGFVKVDERLEVSGLENVFAVGDMSNKEPPQYIFLERQASHMANNVIRLLKGEQLVPYKPFTKSMIGLQIGKQNGVGHWGNWRIPSFLVMYMRKTLFIERVSKVVDGSQF